MSTLEATRVLEQDTLATFIVEQWDEKKGNRSEWEAEKRELRNYVFATDTSKTSNSTLPWKNSTTIPKLCQIRDNLHANYITVYKQSTSPAYLINVRSFLYRSRYSHFHRPLI